MCAFGWLDVVRATINVDSNPINCPPIAINRLASQTMREHRLHHGLNQPVNPGLVFSIHGQPLEK